MIVVAVIVFTSMLMLFSTLNSQHTQTNFPKQNFQLTNIHTASRSSWLDCAITRDGEVVYLVSIVQQRLVLVEVKLS